MKEVVGLAVYVCEYCGAAFLKKPGANQHEKRYCPKNPNRKKRKKPDLGQDLFGGLSC